MIISPDAKRSDATQQNCFFESHHEVITSPDPTQQNSFVELSRVRRDGAGNPPKNTVQATSHRIIFKLQPPNMFQLGRYGAVTPGTNMRISPRSHYRFMYVVLAQRVHNSVNCIYRVTYLYSYVSSKIQLYAR